MGANGANEVRFEELLFLGTHGYVAAIDQRTGAERWRTSLPSTGFSIVTLLFEEGRLFAASGGHCFALDPSSGTVLWHNELRGLGSGALCLATVRTPMNAGADPVPQHVTAQEQQRQSASD